MTNGREQFQAMFDVSRETMDRLDIYHTMLEKWTARINLVSKASLADAWTRHFADSAQLWSLAQGAGASWVDLGSGAGFPGLVIAVLAPDSTRITLVESDQRKAAFLAAVAQACGIRPRICIARIESLDLPRCDILSARALAPLDRLLDYAEKRRRPGGICLFPKGETVHKELEDAGHGWKFVYRVHPSRTDPNAAIVEIGALARA